MQAFGIGVGLCFLLSGLWGLLQLSFSWYGWLFSFVGALVLCTLVGPMLSGMYYQAEEEAAWQFINQKIIPGTNGHKPSYTSWEHRYFSRIPEPFHRAESRALAMN